MGIVVINTVNLSGKRREASRLYEVAVT
jgi:hypothetical protein